MKVRSPLKWDFPGIVEVSHRTCTYSKIEIANVNNDVPFDDKGVQYVSVWRMTNHIMVHCYKLWSLAICE